MERRLAEESEEGLDGPGLGLAARALSLAELDRVNRVLRGDLPLARTLLPRLAAVPRPRRVLDLGAGSGEVVAKVARAAHRCGSPLTVVELDRQLAHLVVRAVPGARGAVPGAGQTALKLVGDARALPFRDGALDWSLSTLFFHHFDAADNARILAEMRRVSREGAVVVDLRRSRTLLVLVRLALAVLRVSRVTRDDGLLSVRRAWTVAEVARLTAGLPVRELRRRIPFRFSLVLGPRS